MKNCLSRKECAPTCQKISLGICLKHDSCGEFVDVIRNETDVALMIKQQPVMTYWGVKIKLDVFLNLDTK
jgi:hypothetical protein